MTISPEIKKIANEIGLDLEDGKHEKTLQKLEALQNLIKLEAIDRGKPWHREVEVDKKAAEKQTASNVQKIDHVDLENVNVAKLDSDLRAIFPDGSDVSYANRLHTLILGKKMGTADLKNTNAGLSPEDDFRGALLKGQITRDEETGKLNIPITKDMLYQLTQAAGEPEPEKINKVSDISGTRIFTWGDSKYEFHVKAPEGEYRMMDARHEPLSMGAIGFISKRDGKDLPLSTDGKPVDGFTGTIPSDNNKENEVKAFVIDQVSELKPYQKGKDKKLDEDIASDKPSKVLIEIEGKPYAIEPKDLGNVQMKDGKPPIFWEPKVVFVDAKDLGGAETARQVYTQTYLKDENDKDYKDPNKRIGDIVEFKDKASFDTWFDDTNKNRHASQWLKEHPEAGKNYVVVDGKAVAGDIPQIVQSKLLSAKEGDGLFTIAEKLGFGGEAMWDAVAVMAKLNKDSLGKEGLILPTPEQIAFAHQNSDWKFSNSNLMVNLPYIAESKTANR